MILPASFSLRDNLIHAAARLILLLLPKAVDGTVLLFVRSFMHVVDGNCVFMK